MLITFAIRLYPDQDRHSAGLCPDRHPTYLTLMVFLQECFESVNGEGTKTPDDKKHYIVPACKQLTSKLTACLEYRHAHKELE